jgi:hypothetical protein
MKHPKLFLAVAFLAGFAVGVVVWQRFVADRLAAENLALRDQVKQMAALTEENAQLRGEQIDPGELKRLRDGQAELLRLRGQAAQLRRETQEAKAAAATAARAGTQSAAEQPQSAESPVESFTNNVTASVGWNHTLATGGWRSPTGNRLFVFLKPAPGTDANTVLVQGKIAEVPEHLLSQLGLEGFKTDGPENAGNVFTPEQSEQLANALEKTEGVKLLGAPRVITQSGQPASVSIAEAHSLPTGERYTTGPTINLVPTIAPDKQTVELVVGAKLDLPRARP